MLRIFAYFISPLLFLFAALSQVDAQDTVLVPLKIKAGLEVSGPIIYFSQKNPLNAEGYVSVDLNEKIAATLAGGYLKFTYSQYNYNYLNNGIFAKAGLDINLLDAKKSAGKYWAGLGLHYGLSRFNWEVTSFQKEDYWGTTASSLGPRTNWAHFLEAAPGVRTEIFKNICLGWSISVRMKLYSGTGKDLPPIDFPGFGNGTKTFSTGLNYFLVWTIPYKKINVIIKKEAPEEPDDNSPATPAPGNSNQRNDSRPAGGRQ
jgi:hypothetical protein